MSGLENISKIQTRLLARYQNLKEQRRLIKESPPKQQLSKKIANYMLAHSNIADSNLTKELAQLNFKSIHQQICTDAIQIYGNQIDKHLEAGQGVYFWIPEAEKDAYGFKINKSLPAVMLLKSVVRDLADYVYDSLTQRELAALEVRDFTVPLREHDILRSQHLPYFINESIYFRQLSKATGSERKRLKNRAEKALLLIWNGFGNEKLDWYYSEIFSLLSTRLENKRPIIFTSDWNFDIFAKLDYKTNTDKLQKKGGRIASRVAGMVGQMIFKLEAKETT